MNNEKQEAVDNICKQEADQHTQAVMGLILTCRCCLRICGVWFTSNLLILQRENSKTM